MILRLDRRHSEQRKATESETQQPLKPVSLGSKDGHISRNDGDLLPVSSARGSVDIKARSTIPVLSGPLCLGGYMSNVHDADGNLITNFPPAVVKGKYSDERAIDVDWFDLHPEDRTPEAELAFGEATVAGEKAEFASGKDETLSGLRETFVAEVLAAKGDTSELRAARENYLDALEANKIIEVISEETKIVEPVVEVPSTEPTQIKENQNGTIDSNSGDKNVVSDSSPVSPRTDI